MNRFLSGAAVAALPLFASATYGQTHSNDVLAAPFFDSFLFDNAGQPDEDFNTYLLWTVSDGSTDLVGGNIPGTNDPVLGRFVDLGGSTGNPGHMQTRLTQILLPGQTYNLSFDYRATAAGAGMQTGSAILGNRVFTVSSDSTTLRNFSTDVAFDTLTIVPLEFQGLETDTDNSGLGIDRVQLQAVVPEPTSLALLGLSGLSLLRRKPR